MVKALSGIMPQPDVKSVDSVTTPDPVRVPSRDDPDLQAARRKAMQRTMMERGGADATDLDRPPSYSRTQLG